LALGGAWVISLIIFLIMTLQINPLYQKQQEQLNNGQITVKNWGGEFHEVEAQNAVKINLRYGPEEQVTMSGTGPSIENMDVNFKNGRLSIARKKDSRICLFCLNKKTPIELNITAPTLDWFYLSGAEEINISGFSGQKISGSINNSDQVKINFDYATSSLSFGYVNKAYITGTSTEISIDSEGYGEPLIDASILSSQSANIKISGDSKIMIDAQDSLKVSSNGEGRVVYSQQPAIEEIFNDETMDKYITYGDGTATGIKLKKIDKDGTVIYKLYSEASSSKTMVNSGASNKNYTAKITIDGYDTIYNLENDVPLPTIIFPQKQ
jgi:hypothetical protein